RESAENSTFFAPCPSNDGGRQHSSHCVDLVDWNTFIGAMRSRNVSRTEQNGGDASSPHEMLHVGTVCHPLHLCFASYDFTKATVHDPHKIGVCCDFGRRELCS